MTMENEDFLFAVAIFLVALMFAIVGFRVGSIIKTEQPIQPELEITIKNGVSDTLYIYRRP